MSCLVIHRGARDCKLGASEKKTFLYRIGSGQVSGRHFVSLNNPEQLYETALKLRDAYTEWVFSLNGHFVTKNLVSDGLSLFFLTDLSNKRNELFDTYETLANLHLIRESLKGEKIDEICLYGVDQAFVESVRSIFPGARIFNHRQRPERIRLVRRLISDVLYFARIVIAIFANLFLAKPGKERDESCKKRYFFSFFPQTFNEHLTEIRYGKLVEPNDAYLVTIMADGMHQQVPIRDYPHLARSLQNSKFVLIDRTLRFGDLKGALMRYVEFHWSGFQEKGRKFAFSGVDISRYIRQEFLWSASRVARLAVIERALDRAIQGLAIRELVYPNFEYAFGRMISALLGKKHQEIVRTGFNHGDYSWRFVNYFLAKGEASPDPPYLTQCPIPDRVWAEDQLCADIYKYNGYCNVEIMKRVDRLTYLLNIKPKKSEEHALIAAGLHDGETLFQCMHEVIIANPRIRFLFKPHPRARNRYLKRLPELQNLQVVDRPIKNLLGFVGMVYVTYSGVGVEALRLGIPTTLVHMPGRISWSKLLDYQNSHHQVDAVVQHRKETRA